MRIIGERAIDTVVGCAIAIAASHLFPYWEYRLMGKLVNNMISATRQYLEASWWWSGKPAAAVVATVTEGGAFAPAAAMADAALEFGKPVLAMANAGGNTGSNPGAKTAASGDAKGAITGVNAAASVGATAGATAGATLGATTSANPQASPGTTTVSNATAKPTGGASAAAVAAATALDRDYRYRLARKNVHVAFANLGQAFQRMMLEPKSAQKFVPELNGLLVRSHVLASQITVAAPLLRTSAQQADSVSLQPLQRALSVIRDNLSEAEAGNAPPADQTEQVKLLARELDAMVVETEKSPEYPADAVHDMKLLAHQCKQMLTASALIRKDASVIRLPEQ
jgi:uncharacterized membrane protein YccC